MLGNKHLVTSICSAYWLLFMCTSPLFCPLKACGRRAAGNMIFQKGACGRSGRTGLRQSAGDDHVNNGLAPRPAERRNIELSDSMCASLRARSNLSETGCGPWLEDAHLLRHHFFLALRVLTTQLCIFPIGNPASVCPFLPPPGRRASLTEMLPRKTLQECAGKDRTCNLPSR